MKNFICCSLLAVVFLALMGCAPSYYLNDRMRTNPPKVVLVLPPENMTPNTEVQEKLYPIIYDILEQRGYYCISPELAQAVFNANKMNDAGRVNSLPVSKFKEIFGADAVLKTRVTDWSTKYIVISSSVTVGLDMQLWDTDRGDTLWTMKRTLSQSPDNSNAGLIGAMINAAVSAATVQYEPIAADNVQAMYNTIPQGIYKW